MISPPFGITLPPPLSVRDNTNDSSHSYLSSSSQQAERSHEPEYLRNITRARGTTASVSIVIHSPITTQSRPSEELHSSTPDLINFNESPSLPVLVYQEDMGALAFAKDDARCCTRMRAAHYHHHSSTSRPPNSSSPEISLSGLHSDSVYSTAAGQ